MQIKNVRFIIAAITTFSAYAVYVSRVNLSIAIIAMVEDHHAETHKLSERNADVQSLDDQIFLRSLSGGEESAAAAATSHQQVAHESQWEPPINAAIAPPLVAMAANRSTSSASGDPVAKNGLGATASNNNATKPHREPLSTIFPASRKSVKMPLISQEKFHWDQTEQGHILGAFFYGYILFQIPGARMAESVGAKWIIMASNAGSALISLAFPLSTQLNSIHLLMVLRFVMGLCQSAFFPAAYVLFCRWLPEHERSVLLPIMFIGSNVGSISTYIMSSYLISTPYGWPSVFYMSGLVCTLVSLLWWVFGSNGPHDNWLITEGERNYIENNANDQSSESNLSLEKANASDDLVLEVKVGASAGSAGGGGGATATATRINGSSQLDGKRVAPAHKKPEIPEPSWSKLLKSIPIWTLILSMYGNEWSNVVLCYELPTYLNTALEFPIEKNGLINSFFQLSYAVASPIMSSLGAYMLDKHVLKMHKIHVRKLFQSLATFGQMACFVSVPICGANRGLIILFMFSAIVFKACANAGDIMVSGDLSPEYAGTIFAFANSIGNTAGFFVPLLAGALVENPYKREDWMPFWLTTAIIMGCSGFIFLVFGETRRQDLARDSSKGLGDDDDEELDAKMLANRATSDTTNLKRLDLPEVEQRILGKQFNNRLVATAVTKRSAAAVATPDSQLHRISTAPSVLSRPAD